MFGYVSDYLRNGWEVPFPLPEGAKYPPVSGVTGRIPRVKRAEVDNLWKGRPEESNVGLRMQVSKGREVIGIDVDHYGSKQGMTFLNELMEELGDLNLDEIPRSTRRGVRSQSAQYFFLVPKGKEWNAKVCSDVDVVQFTHRYSAVWPSVVEGEQYKWYIGEEEVGIPNVNDLPTLPEKWVNHLTRDKSGRRGTGERKAIGGYREALNWLRDNISGWDVEADSDDDPNVLMSPSMRDASTSDTFVQNLSTNAHDTMISAIHSVVMLGTEGHHGLKAAIHHIRSRFMSEVLDERGPNWRNEDIAKDEFERAVISEVEKIAGEVERGEVRIINASADMAIPNFSELLVPAEAEKRPLGVDWNEYGNHDQGHALMFKDYWDRDVLVTTDNGSQEFAAWVTKTGRYSFRSLNQMFRFIEYAVCSPLDYEASKLEERAEGMAEKEAQEQIDADDTSSDDLEAMAANLRNRANGLRNTRPARAMLAQLHSVDEVSCSLDDFDSVPMLLGSKNAQTLDLNALTHEDVSPVRDSRRSDMLTMSTAVSVQEGANHKAWDDFLDKFLPDPEIRRFAQKVFGYSLVDHNPSKLLVFLWGPSNTGKTTILEAMAAALGDYAAPMNAQRLFGFQGSGPNPELVSVMNKRMLILSEVGDGHRLSSNAIKQATGNDLQQARKNHSNHIVNSVPRFTPYVSTNNPPNIDRGDEALKNRILVLPFKHPHPPHRTDPKNDLKQNKEISSAILWWIIEGCRMYLEEGLERDTWPKEVREVSEEFVSGTSAIQRFITERLERDEKGREKLDDLFKAWKSWCMSESMDQRDVGTKDGFRKLLQSNGFKYVRNTSIDGERNVSAFRGLKIK